MKLISLNTWGGKYFEPLINFIKQNSQDTDIFCFQEIYDTKSDVKQYKNIIRANLLKELKNILPTFQTFYFPILFGFDDEAEAVDFQLNHGPAIFIKKNIPLDSHKDYFIYKDQSLKSLKKDFSNLATPLQYIGLNLNGKKFSIFNFHGTPYPLTHKLDSPNRLAQAKKAKHIIDSKSGAKILVGDFNLFPQTRSLRILGEGMQNLIMKYHIERTRSNLNPFYGKPDFQKFADYTFVTSDVNVTSFQVPDVEISDHLPMILEFS